MVLALLCSIESVSFIVCNHLAGEEGDGNSKTCARRPLQNRQNKCSLMKAESIAD